MWWGCHQNWCWNTEMGALRGQVAKKHFTHTLSLRGQHRPMHYAAIGTEISISIVLCALLYDDTMLQCNTSNKTQWTTLYFGCRPTCYRNINISILHAPNICAINFRRQSHFSQYLWQLLVMIMPSTINNVHEKVHESGSKN